MDENNSQASDNSNQVGVVGAKNPPLAPVTANVKKPIPAKAEKHELGYASGAVKRLNQELVVAGYSPRTIKMYCIYLGEFLGAVKRTPEEISREDIVGFLANKKSNENVSNATIALVHSSLKFYFHNVLRRKIVEEIKVPKKAKKLPTVLTKEEIVDLIKAAEPGRDRLIVEFLYSSGCRVSEVVKLKTENLDLGGFIGSVRGGKGNKDRTIILSKSWCAEIKNFLKKKKVKTPFVFSKKNGKPISTDTIQRMIRETAQKAGIQKEVTPHKLRHSYATHLLEGGENIRKIQELLGHSNLNTTQIYTQVSTQELKKVVSPLDRLRGRPRAP